MWRVTEIFGYWRNFPPVHELVAAFMGVKPKPTISSPSVSGNDNDPSGIGGLVAMFPSGFVPADR